MHQRDFYYAQQAQSSGVQLGYPIIERPQNDPIEQPMNKAVSPAVTPIVETGGRLPMMQGLQGQTDESNRPQEIVRGPPEQRPRLMRQQRIRQS